jgi:ABC-type nickel/cobalt efflux system permease component RcnA
MARRLAAALTTAIVATLAVAATALGHPLGNYTVNRAVSVTLAPGALAVRYTIDMAEIPAFAALQEIDLDADGITDLSEQRAWAGPTCEASRAALDVMVDGEPLALASAGDPWLTFPPGAGGLETLRLECPLTAAWAPEAGEHRLVIRDSTDDGHVGWREVTIAAGGWSLLSSDVPAISPSQQLTAYPTDSLAAPLDIRSGSATFRAEGSMAPPPRDSRGATVVGPRSTSNDPFAALIAGELTLPVALLALLLAAGLGAVHALSPGHGKTLVAAYLIGSRGTLRQAAGLGVTVAVTHTLGVFALGGFTLAAGELFIPERVIGWLSVASGGLVAGLGIVLVWRALRPGTRRSPHDHMHRPGAEHPHPHSHPQDDASSAVSVRGLLALGLAGGMVPSASALIVLLAAVSTGRLLFGLGLIVSFGVGMAAVLAGLAAATTVARSVFVDRHGIGSWPLARRVTGLLPVASGIAVLVIGTVVTVAALGRIG